MPYALREALAAFRRAPLLTGLSALMIGLSLFVVGLFGLSTYNIRQVLDRVESRVEVVAYLQDGTPADAVRLAQEEISAFPEVREVLYVSREQALEVARQELDEFQLVFSDLEVNPLPASFEVTLRPTHRTPETVRAVADRIAGYDFVEDVRYGREWLDKVFLLRRIAAAAALIMGIAFAAVAAVIIGTAVRLAIFARREEIAIMRLVGATRGFVRRPFLLEGLFTGLLGAGIALACTYGVYRVLSRAVVDLEWIPDAWVLGGLGAGALVGVLASALAVRKYLEAV